MAQTGFMLSDEGRTITVTNHSSTTAITAGDLVYCAVNNDIATGTAAAARNAYAGGEVKVKMLSCSATGYKTIVGVALEDIPASGLGTIAMEGIFLHPVSADSEAGDAMMGYAGTASKIKKIPDAVMATATTTGITNIKTAVDNQRYRIGKALSGGSADGKYVAWKLTF